MKTEPNPDIHDGWKIVSGSGKTYTVMEYASLHYPGKEEPYRTFKIVNSQKQKIGTFTQHTPTNRINSLIKRYEKPEHMKSFEMITKISGTGSTGKEFLYVNVPRPVIEWADVEVDDPIEITITRKDGRTITDSLRHVSQMGDQLVINLSRSRRLCQELRKKKLTLMTITEYQDQVLNRPQRPFLMYLHKGDVVKISVKPRPENHNYYFAENMKAYLSGCGDDVFKVRMAPDNGIIEHDPNEGTEGSEKVNE